MIAYRKRSGSSIPMQKVLRKTRLPAVGRPGDDKPTDVSPRPETETEHAERHKAEAQSIAGAYRAVGTYTQNNRPAVLRQQAGCFHLHTKEVTRRSG